MSDPVFRLEVAEDLEGGVYANVASVWHTAHEFTIDFGATKPPEADDAGAVTLPIRVVSRVKLPVSVIFDLLKALNTNMTAYEAKFGQISGPALPDIEDGTDA